MGHGTRRGAFTSRRWVPFQDQFRGVQPLDFDDDVEEEREHWICAPGQGPGGHAVAERGAAQNVKEARGQGIRAAGRGPARGRGV
jgi:hypothetical protein